MYKHEKVKNISFTFPLNEKKQNYLLRFGSSETVNFFRPFARRAAKTFRPLADAILFLNPCLFRLFVFDG